MPAVTSITLHKLITNKKLVDESGTCLSYCLLFTAWGEELHGDIDREIILNGLQNIFDIIDKDVDPIPV